MPRRLTLPSTLVVAAIGTASLATTLAITACGDDSDDPPQECMIEGVCPEDGRVCLDEQTAAPCCPVCPTTPGQCPSGCILEFPPI